MNNKSVFLFLLLIMAECLHAADAKFFIALSSNNKAAATNLAYFESRFSIGLKNAFPCVSTFSQADAGDLLELERQKELLGVGDVDQLSNIAQAMGSDYLVSLSVKVLENKAIIDAFIVKLGQNKVISRISATAPNGDASLDAVEKASKQLVEELQQYKSQLCKEKTWKGTVTIEQHTSIKLPNVDPKKPGGISKGDISVQCQVENNVAQCTINYSDEIIGSEGNSNTSAAGKDQTDASISVTDGKTSISLGIVTAKGTSSGSIGGGGYSSEVTITLGGWNVDAAGGTGTTDDSSSGSVNQGDLNISWNLTKK